MRVIRKLLVPTLLFVGLVIAGVITFNTIISNRQVNEVEHQRLEDMNALFNTRLTSLGNLAVALASETANNPEIQAAFAAKDRERLTELTLASYQSINAQFDIPQHQFHLAPATSFLRLHNLDKFGDDLSSFRFTVLAANAEKRPISGPEIGRGGLGVRGVVPVSYNGEHIGTVEFGINVDKALLESLKKGFGFEWQLLLNREDAKIATFEGATEEDSQGPINDLLLQASTLTTPIYGPTQNYEQALAGATSIEHTQNDGAEYVVLSAPLYDFSGNVIGVIDIISDHTPIVKKQNRQILLSLGVLLLTLLFSSVGFSLIANYILRPIETLSTTANAISKGDFSQRADASSDDEIGTLAQVFNTMTEQLQELFGTLEERVTDATQNLILAAEVGRSISQISDVDTLLKDTVNLIRDRFNMYYTQVYLLDSEGRQLVMRAGTGTVGEQLLNRHHSLPMDLASLNGTAAIEKHAVIVENTEKSIIHRPNPLLPKTRSEMVVPLLVGGRILGVLDMQSSEAGALNKENLVAFEALAGQIALAVQNAQALHEAEISRAEIEAQTQRLTRAGWREFLDAIERGERIGYRYNNNELSPFTENITSSPQEKKISTEIQISNQAVGILELEAQKTWTNDDAELVNDVAQQLGQQIENLRLLAQADQYRFEAEEALRRLTREGWDNYQNQIKEAELSYLYKDSKIQSLAQKSEKFEDELTCDIKVHNEKIGQFGIEGSGALSDEDIELAKSITEQLSAHLENLRLSKQTEQALSETQSALEQVQRLGSAVEYSANTIVITDIEGTIEYVNPTFEKSTGFSAKEALGENSRIINSGKQTKDFYENLWSTIKSGNVWVGDFLNKRKDGTLYWETATIAPILNDAGKITNFIAVKEDISERKATEVATEKRAAELETVAEVSTAAARLLDIDELLQEVVDLTRKGFDLYHVHIYLLDKDKEHLEIQACGWEEGSPHTGKTHAGGAVAIPLSAEKSLVAQSARSGQAVIVNDVRQDPNWLPNEMMPNTHSEMAIPLIVGDDIIGVFDIQSTETNHFTSEDISIQTTLASQVAVALQNARSFQQARQQAEQESTINLISQRIQGTTSVEEALQVAVRELGRALGAKQASIQLDVGTKRQS